MDFLSRPVGIAIVLLCVGILLYLFFVRRPPS